MAVVGNASRKNHVRSRTLDPSAGLSGCDWSSSCGGKAMPFGVGVASSAE